jgi:trigger factor
VWVRVPLPALYCSLRMNISKTNSDSLNGIITVEVTPDDYRSQVDELLENYRKQAKIPGFRTGKVPMALIRKQYQKSVLVDELNKMLGSKIDTYIRDEKLRLLGQPIPCEDNASEGDWDKPDVFTFRYDVGYSPAVDIKFGWFTKFVHHKVKIDDTMINKQVRDLRRRFGKMSEPETSGAEDMLVGTFVELNEQGEILAGGVMHEATISIDDLDHKATAKMLVGLKKDASVDVDPRNISKDTEDLGRMLGLEADAAGSFKSNARFTVKEIRHIEAAELGSGFYDKVFGEGKITDEEGMRLRVREDLSVMFDRDADTVFRRKFVAEVIDKLNPPLPEEFLKRWIQVANEKPISKEEVDQEFSEYAKGIKWQVIQNQIIDEHKLEVKREEIESESGEMMKAQYAQYGIPLEAEQMAPMVANMMTQDKEVRRIAESLYERKAIDKLRELAKIKEKEIDYDAFMKVVKAL